MGAKKPSPVSENDERNENGAKFFALKACRTPVNSNVHHGISGQYFGPSLSLTSPAFCAIRPFPSLVDCLPKMLLPPHARL